MNQEILLNPSWLILGCHMAVHGKDEVLVLSSQGKDIIQAKVEIRTPAPDISIDAALIMPPSRTLLTVEMAKAQLVQSGGSAGNWYDALVLPT